MIGLKNSIYSTLFPFLDNKKPQIDDGSVRHPAGNSFIKYDGGETEEAPLTLEQADEMYKDFSLAPQPKTPTPIENIPLVPVAAPEARPVSFDTTGLENVIARTPYEEAKLNAETVAAEPVKKQDAWKNILWAALQGADMVFGNRKPKDLTWYGEEKKNRTLAEANRQLAPLQAVEDRNAAAAQQKAKLAKAQADAQAVILGNQGKVLSNANAAGKFAYETLKAKDYITPEEAAAFTQKYGVEIVPYDARKFKTQYENGVPFAIPELGAPNAQVNPTLPVRRREIETPVSVGESRGYSTSEDGLKMKVAAEKDRVSQQIAEQNVQRRESEKAEEREYRNEKEQRDDLQRWQKAESDRQRKLIEVTDKLNAAKNRLEANRGYAEADAIQKEVDELNAQKLGLSVPEPKPQGKIKSQTIKAKEYSTVKPKSDPLGLFK